MSRAVSTPTERSSSAEPFRTKFSIVSNPDSLPIGRALLRQSFMPLYSAGLWLAVNIAPGSPSLPEAKYNISVEANPMRMTSIPKEVTPAEKASASGIEDGRISSPMTTVPGSRCCWRNRAKATPVANVKSGVISISTSPRMS